MVKRLLVFMCIMCIVKSFLIKWTKIIKRDASKKSCLRHERQVKMSRQVLGKGEGH